MSSLALLASYSGVIVSTWLLCKLLATVDGGCDGQQFLDINRPFDWDLDGAFDDHWWH